MVFVPPMFPLLGLIALLPPLTWLHLLCNYDQNDPNPK